MHGRGLQVSLGYFLLPLVLVLAGSVLYGEKISKFQWVAIVLAIIGVGHEIFRLGSIAWETALVAIGYSAYFLLRKKIKTDNLGGFWWDLLIIMPVAIYLTHTGLLPYSKFLDQPTLGLVIAGLGVLSAIGLGCYILASRYLPLVVFGLLGYLEPVLLALASLVLGESIGRRMVYLSSNLVCRFRIGFRRGFSSLPTAAKSQKFAIKYRKISKKIKK